MTRFGRRLRFVLVSGCLGVSAALCEVPLSPRASAYLDAAIDIMQEDSLHRHAIEWADLRRRAREHAAGAETEADTYEAIRFALRELGDHHSFLQILSPDLKANDAEARARRKDRLPFVTAGTKWPPSPYIGRDMPGGVMETVDGLRISRLIVPATSAPDAAAMRLYANELGATIARLRMQRPAGWIVDLRGNLGGNMWPMLAGLEPLLHGDNLGIFIDPEGRRETWFADATGAGTRKLDGSRRVICPAPEVTVPLSGDPPVAVLFDGGTASAAEAVAIAFIRRPNTRSFGRHTSGQSTGNRSIPLSDGARLVLTEVAEADRSGQVYPDGIAPDGLLAEEITSPASGTVDPMTQAAGRWIATQQRGDDDVLNTRLRLTPGAIRLGSDTTLRP